MVPLIPRRVLFGNPERFAPRLSPDGRRLAYIAPDEGVLNVWVKTVGGNDDVAVTRDRHRGVRAYEWAENDRHLLYVQDRDGDENWHVYAVPAGGGEARDLTPFEGVNAQIVSVEPALPGWILVGLNDRDPRLHDVHRIEVATGRRTMEVRNDVGAIGWVADHALRVRVAQVPTPDGGGRLLHRSSAGEDWREILAWGPEDGLNTAALGFGPDDLTLHLISSKGSNTGELRTLDCRTGEETRVAGDPHADVSSVFVHPTRHTLQAAAFVRDRKEWTVLDPGVQDDFDTLGRLHEGDFQVVNRDRADRTWLVAYVQDRGPVVYYAYDREEKQGTFLFSSRPELEEQPLAAKRPVEVRARDGLALHGYLTLPLDGHERLPAVIVVHGGPWSRDSWGYDPEAQWLANRGYAVLQVNFRGSIGYGKDFINAGDREWGRKMQDDITDSLRWLVERGTADPSKIGIFGGSYGGYAVLSGLTTTPELYACGVDIVGPSNLITWMNTIPPYWEPFRPLLLRRVGDPQKDAAFLESRSPLFHKDRIRAPLLIAQGANDPRVPRAESLQIRDALVASGKTVEYMEFPDEGHGFARPENRMRFYAAAERFLARHLGGRCEEEPAEGGEAAAD